MNLKAEMKSKPKFDKSEIKCSKCLYLSRFISFYGRVHVKCKHGKIPISIYSEIVRDCPFFEDAVREVYTERKGYEVMDAFSLGMAAIKEISEQCETFEELKKELIQKSVRCAVCGRVYTFTEKNLRFCKVNIASEPKIIPLCSRECKETFFYGGGDIGEQQEGEGLQTEVQYPR